MYVMFQGQHYLCFQGQFKHLWFQQNIANDLDLTKLGSIIKAAMLPTESMPLVDETD